MSIAEVLASTKETAGPAPKKFTTPFLVAMVSPTADANCNLRVVTNGMAYIIVGKRSDGGCNHLPRLHSLVWGRVTKGKNKHDSTERLDLVYRNDAKVQAQAYAIVSASAIGLDWGNRKHR